MSLLAVAQTWLQICRVERPASWTLFLQAPVLRPDWSSTQSSTSVQLSVTILLVASALDMAPQTAKEARAFDRRSAAISRLRLLLVVTSDGMMIQYRDSTIQWILRIPTLTAI